jgi:hypothetical protein
LDYFILDHKDLIPFDATQMNKLVPNGSAKDTDNSWDENVGMSGPKMGKARWKRGDALQSFSFLHHCTTLQMFMNM